MLHLELLFRKMKKKTPCIKLKYLTITFHHEKKNLCISEKRYDKKFLLKSSCFTIEVHDSHKHTLIQFKTSHKDICLCQNKKVICEEFILMWKSHKSTLNSTRVRINDPPPKKLS